MTSPGDDGLEEALRRALSDAASEIEPGTDGLDRIRGRIGNRPPRPWLFSLLSGLVDRVRHWTWRGHWAWQDFLPGLSALRERRSRRGNFQGQGAGWVRFVTVLAGIAALAGIALGVQPFRHAILQAGSSLNDGGGPPRASAGTEGSGTQAASGSSTPTTAAVASSGGQSSQARTTASGRAAAPHPTSSAGCVSTVLPVLSAAKPSQATVAAEAAGTSSATRAPSSLSSGSSTPAQPVYTSTNGPACPAAPPTRTPTPTPTSSSASLGSTPSDVPPTGSSSPAGGDPTPTPTASGSSPTGDPSNGTPSNGDPPSSSPADPPSLSWESWQQRRHAGLGDPHHRRR